MSDYFKLNWQYLLGAALLHVLFAGVFALTMIQMSRNAPPPTLAIQAVIVDSSKLAQAPSRPKKPDVDLEAQAAEQRQKEEAAQREKEEQERQAQSKQREEEQKQQEEEQQRQRDAQEQQIRERQETERKQAAEAQAEREQAEAKLKAEAEAKAKAEADRKRVAEIERKQKEEAERRKTAEEAQSRATREAELRRQLAEEEGRTQAVNSGLLNQYVAMIEQRVVRNWNRPASARPGLECEVRVTQTPGGTVLTAQVTQCNGDAAVKQSIEAAVLRSSPLPPPPDPSLFERNLVFIFKPAE
jgi:colicin import membrane protein